MRDVFFLLLSATAITNNILWASVYHRTEVRHIFYPGDLLLTIFFFSTFWLIQFVRNTKEVEKLSNELILADKRKDEFLANTSHELRSPLHSIINIAYSILNNTNNQIEQNDKNDLELIVTVGRRMSYMVNDLLDLARIKENRLRIHRKKTNLHSVLSSTVQMIEYLIKDKEVIIINNVPLHTPYVYADESRLAQIFMNLIHNAVKYTKKGQIEIAVEKIDGNHLCVRVSDTGIGMDSKKLTSIFQPYEQLNVSSSGGLGLGLTITKQLIEMHDGKINVTSSVGKGTTFEFTLPMFEEQEEFTLLENDQIEMLNSIFSPTIRETAVVLEKESTKQLDTKMKLLLIDDESINLHVLTRILSDEAFEITTTTRAVEALQLVKTHQWDLIICDVMMPEMNGYELTKEIRTIYNLYELPI
ncbi:hybrid sensor histidine kinase/response regulator, partial [Alcanivoracaceae bacterium MT1]